MEVMRRGEIWIGNLNPNRGAETGKIRPVLIVQEDTLTQIGAKTILVTPLSSQLRPGLSPYRVSIPARDKLRHDSQVMVDRMRALDRSRFGDGPLTTLTAEEMAAVEKSLLAVLGMYR